jgi:hypothetical protein
MISAGLIDKCDLVFFFKTLNSKINDKRKP